MELSFIHSADQARRLAMREVGAVTLGIKRERFEAMGLGLGFADQRDVVMDLDGREKLWRLVRVDYDPNEPTVVDTGWVLAPDTSPFDR